MTQPSGDPSCRVRVEDDDELQWRQVHPRYLEKRANGPLVSRDAFVGTPAATREVSTARSSVVSAEEAYEYHRDQLGLKTEGAWAVSVREATSVGCPVVDDSECDGVNTPGHSFIDMRALNKSDARKARNELATRANERGRSFP
jgi:hypothetical protein